MTTNARSSPRTGFPRRKYCGTPTDKTDPMDNALWSALAVPDSVAQRSMALSHAVSDEWRGWQSHHRYALYKTATSKSQPEAFEQVVMQLRNSLATTMSKPHEVQRHFAFPRRPAWRFGVGSVNSTVKFAKSIRGCETNTNDDRSSFANTELESPCAILLIFIAMVAAAALVGTQFGPGPWYVALQKPSGHRPIGSSLRSGPCSM